MKILYEWEPSDISGGTLAFWNDETYLVTFDPEERYAPFGLVSISTGKSIVVERTAEQLADDLNEFFAEPDELIEVEQIGDIFVAVAQDA
jgi:hypothetical protein